jgi:hypothetical protein
VCVCVCDCVCVCVQAAGDTHKLMANLMLPVEP